jgi:hypothetical protein
MYVFHVAIQDDDDDDDDERREYTILGVWEQSKR